MNSHRLPVNVYSYEPKIFGVSVRRILLYSTFVSVAVLISRVSIFLTLLVLILLGAILLRNLYPESREASRSLPLLPRLRISEIRRDLSLNIREFNGHVLLLMGRRVYLICKVQAPNILLMKRDLQELIYEHLREALDKLDCDTDFYSFPFEDLPDNTIKRGVAIQTYIAFSKAMVTNAEDNEFMSFISGIASFQDELGPSEVMMLELKRREDILEFLERVET